MKSQARKTIIKPKVKRKESPEKRNYSLEIKMLLPLLRTLPSGYRINAYRKVIAGKEIIKYQITFIANQELAAEAEVKRIDGRLVLDNLHVVPSYRNLGLASYLIDTVIINHQAHEIYLIPEETHDKNVSRDTLEKFFSKFGFSVIDKKGTMVRKATPLLDFAGNDEIVM